MNRTDRLTGILLALQAGSSTAAVLAARFEVSRRTILRDVDALCQLGVPVIALSGPNGGYRLPEDYWLPPLHLSVEEATVLLFALAHLGNGDASPLGAARGTAEQKIRASLRPSERSASAEQLAHLTVASDENVPAAATVAALRHAVADEHWLDIEYRSTRGDSRRAILPRTVQVDGGRWYTSAVDALTAELRVFRIDRIGTLNRAVPPPDAAALVARATAVAVAYDDSTHPEIRVALSSRGVRLAANHPDFHRHLTGADADRAGMAFRCPPAELPYYARELVMFGADATIIAPTSLRAMVIDAARTLLDHHTATGHGVKE
ncbi:MAG: YafY family transcriptional regulator [Chloroflexia bacterium]|nr:YafY family transcriptional regulator [Chloroflexia bacterium]